MSTFPNDWLLHAPGARDLAAVFSAHRADLQAATMAAMQAIPVFAGSEARHTPEQRSEAFQRFWSSLDDAFAGNWESRAAVVRAAGALYAKAGATIADWQAVLEGASVMLRRELLHLCAGDTERVLDGLTVLQQLLDRSVEVFTEAYVKAAETELRQSETWFRLMSSGLVIMGEGGAMRSANDAFLELYGLTGEVLSERTLTSLFDPDALAQVRAQYTEAALRSGRASYDTVHLRADGSRFPVRVDAVRLSPPNEPAVWGISVTDLTDRRQAEALRARSAELEAENAKVREASRVKSEFLANMSHELRTPLNSILGFSELLQGGDVGSLSAQQLEFVHDIHTSGKHLLRLINDVLDLSKVEAGKLEFYPEDVDLLEVAREVVHLSRGLDPNRHVDVEVDEAVRHAFLDQSRLKQVLHNYLSNALKFSPQSTRITVRLTPESEGTFRLSVIDRGVGIEQADLQRLFLAFEQLDAGRGKHHGGTGLGLALTRRLVEAQGGLVGADSEVGVGSTFHAVLPLRAAGTHSLPEPRRILGAHAEAPHVLVIEDDPEDQDRIVAALVAAGYAVDTAATGAQALRSVRERRYEAITLDLILPDTHGFALLREIRRVPGLDRVPVVVISVVSEQASAGIVVHAALRKPLQPDDLVAALENLAERESRTGGVLVIDDDEASARLMARSLGQLGFRAILAHDGQQALDLLEHERPTAIVLDLAMPKVDGFEFLRRLRQDGGGATIPVLVWSVKDLSRNERKELMKSARAVIPKDGSGMRSLLDTLRAHLGARPTTPPPAP